MHTEIAVTVMLSESGMDDLRQAMASDKTGDATPAFADAPGSGFAMPPPDTSSVTPRKKKEKFSFPAVWFGDFRQADIGSFGSEKKPEHFAVVLPPADPLSPEAAPPLRAAVKFAPSSSQNRNPGDPTVVDLPPSAIHSKPGVTSYILTEHILLVSRRRLGQGPFEYKHQLAPKYARVIRKVLPQ
jgi:hypothetical protein